MTSEAKHTPGPWRAGHLIDDCHECECRYIFGNDGRMGCVATVSVAGDRDNFPDEYPTRDEAKANMRLIAAAPDLLEALEVAANTLHAFDEGDQSSETGWKNDELLEAWKLCTAAISRALRSE